MTGAGDTVLFFNVPEDERADLVRRLWEMDREHREILLTLAVGWVGSAADLFHAAETL